jgi:hypothetical protein
METKTRRISPWRAVALILFVLSVARNVVRGFERQYYENSTSPTAIALTVESFRDISLTVQSFSNKMLTVSTPTSSTAASSTAPNVSMTASALTSKIISTPSARLNSGAGPAKERGTPTALPTAVVDGWKKVELVENELSIDIPANWEEIPGAQSGIRWRTPNDEYIILNWKRDEYRIDNIISLRTTNPSRWKEALREIDESDQFASADVELLERQPLNQVGPQDTGILCIGLLYKQVSIDSTVRMLQCMTDCRGLICEYRFAQFNDAPFSQRQWLTVYHIAESLKQPE